MLLYFKGLFPPNSSSLYNFNEKYYCVRSTIYFNEIFFAVTVTGSSKHEKRQQTEKKMREIIRQHLFFSKCKTELKNRTDSWKSNGQ